MGLLSSPVVSLFLAGLLALTLFLLFVNDFAYSGLLRFCVLIYHSGHSQQLSYPFT